jgi:F-type H+-transporting ATPase subunit b
MADQIEAEKAQAVTTLQKDVGSLALELASKVVGESLKDDSRARAVIDQYITDLERQAKEAGR